MNKRQAKKRERKELLLQDSGTKSYREAKEFRRWVNKMVCYINRPQATPNYWGE